ncbi:7152_t:CDS:1, partial [Racocetra persica]
LHTDTSPHPSLPPVMASSPNRSALSEHITSVRHEPRSPLFYSDIPQSSSRMPRKSYYNDGHSMEFAKKWDQVRDRERDRGFDRERDRERLMERDRERERQHLEREREIERDRREKELRLIERERDFVRARDQTRYYEMERELPRNRTSGYEYGREIDRVRTPFYNREQELRDRDFVRYRDTELDPYVNRHSPPGHSTYRDNYKRFNDYYYHPATYSATRRSVSPRPRYSTRRSLSPGARQPIATYERRYDRDRPPRFDAARGHEVDSRRDVDYNYHYNDAHNPGYNHYSPMIHNSQTHVRSYDDNVIGTSASSLNNETFQRDRPKSRHWGVNNEKERDIKKIHSNPNDVYSDNYDRYRRERRKPWDVVEKSREDEDEQNESSVTTATVTNIQERARDRERDERQRSWDVKEEKTRD